MKNLLAFVVICVGLIGSAHAQAVNTRTLTWDAPAIVAGQPTPAGYNVYCGQSADATGWPTAPAKVVTGSSATNNTTGLMSLSATQLYCAVKAFASGGLESAISNIVSTTPPGVPVIKITQIETITDVFSELTGELLSHGVERTAMLEHVRQ